MRTERQLYAIYAFSSAEAYSINTQKGMDKERKKAALLFLLAITFLSATLLCVLFVLTDEVADNSFTALEATTPCCKKQISLNDLNYNFPCGFACCLLGNYVKGVFGNYFNNMF